MHLLLGILIIHLDAFAYTFTIILGDEEEWNAGKGYVSHKIGY